MDRKIAAALVSALAIGVTSCGSAQPKLTRQQLVARVELACHEAGQTTEREMSAGGGTGSSSYPIRYATAVLAGQHVLVARLKGINPPAADTQHFDAFRTGIQQRLHVLEQLAGAVRSHRHPTSTVEQQSLAIFRRLDTLAKMEGFAGCI